MKSRIFCKSKLLFLLGLSCFIGPLSSCSAFFGGDEYTITDTQVTTDENGNTIVTITFSGEDIAPLTFTIPSITDGVGIESIEPTLNDDEVTLTISYTDESKEDTIITIPIIKGQDGKGISNVEFGYDEDENTTMQFFYTDGTTSEIITIKRGEDGSEGPGIKDFTVTPTGLGSNILTIYFTDDREPVTFTVSDGVSVDSIEYNSEESTDEFYILDVTFSDGRVEKISLPRPTTNSWLVGNSNPDSEQGKINDFYININTGYVFRKINDTTWEILFCMKGENESSDPLYYSITFNLSEDEHFNNSDEKRITYLVEENKNLALDYIPIPIKSNSIFDGWYESVDNPNSGKFTSFTNITRNLELFARRK